MNRMLLILFLIYLFLPGFSRPVIACGPPTCPSCEQWSYYWNQCVGVNCGGDSCVSCAGGSCQLCGGNPEKCCPGIPGWACVDRCGGSGGPCCAAEGKFCCPGGSGSACCNPGEGCCDGQCFDKDTQDCCGGYIYNKATQGCCGGGQVYNLATECCVNGSVLPKCGSECCDPKQCEECNSILMECMSKCDPIKCEECDGEGHCVACDGEPFKGCCNGECYDARGQGCCNGQIYDLETQQCCEGYAITQVCLKTRTCCPSGECCNLDHCQGCNPESGTCDDLCEECHECISDYCIPCWLLDKTCCDGWCEQPCEQHEENNCNVSNNTDCLKCVGGEEGCGPAKKVYTGYSTTTCSGGCFGDCQDLNDEVCYAEYTCKWAGVETSSICLDPSGTGCTPAMGFDCATCGMDVGTKIEYPSTQAACQ